MHDTEAYIVCNGYKDEEFIDLALHAQKMGLKVMLVLEMPTELPDTLDTPEMRQAMAVLKQFTDEERDYHLYQRRLDARGWAPASRWRRRSRSSRNRATWAASRRAG